MLEFLLADENLPFAVALAVVGLLALLEGVGMVLGAGLSGLLDALLPDAWLPDVDVDLPDTASPGTLSGVLGWLYIGKVPFLIVLILLLLSFGLAGLLLQTLMREVTGALLPGWLAGSAALGLALPATRAGARAALKILPRDETEAVSADSFVGRVAVLTLGAARRGRPSQARVKDRYGQSHYVLVEPLDNGELPAGAEVLLVEKKGHLFRAIPNSNPLLKNE